MLCDIQLQVKLRDLDGLADEESLQLGHVSGQLADALCSLSEALGSGGGGGTVVRLVDRQPLDEVDLGRLGLDQLVL